MAPGPAGRNIHPITLNLRERAYELRHGAENAAALPGGRPRQRYRHLNLLLTHISYILTQALFIPLGEGDDWRHRHVKTHVTNIAYVLLHALSIPLKALGLSLISFRQVWTSRRLGVSATAIAVINERWIMDVFGIREDAATRALNRVLPNSSVAGMWLALFPLYFLYRISGQNRFYPCIPTQGEEAFHHMIMARTLCYDEIIERARDSIDQFVLLGAGFDTDPPPLNWSTPYDRNGRIEDGNQTTQT